MLDYREFSDTRKFDRFEEFDEINETLEFKEGMFTIQTTEGTTFAFNTSDIKAYFKRRMGGGTRVVDNDQMLAPGYNPHDFDRAKGFVQKNKRDTWYELHIKKGRYPYIVLITGAQLKKMLKKARRDTAYIERTQVVGFYCNKSFNEINGPLGPRDFSQLYEGGNEILPRDRITDPERINYIKGVVQFKEFLEGDKDFSIIDIKHDNKEVAAKIKDAETRALAVFGLPPFTKKPSTADLYLFDFMYEPNIFDNKIIVPYPSTKDSWNGICYIIPSDDVINSQAMNIYDPDTAGIKEFEEVCKSIIDSLQNKDDIPKFVQVSLKKSRDESQFGKTTKELEVEFPVNESWTGRVYNWIKTKFKSYWERIRTLYTTLFNKYRRMMGEHVNTSKRMLVNFIDNMPVNEAYRTAEDIVEFRTGVHNDVLFVDVVDDNKARKNLSVQNLGYKLYASERMDSLLQRILAYLGGLAANTSSFHKKMAGLVSGAIMGATNLPMYIVYAFKEGEERSYSLHKSRMIKLIHQYNNLVRAKREEELPIYMVRIRNYKDRVTNALLYRSMDIYIYNYSTSEGEKVFMKIRLNTGSSSNRSFFAETLAPTGTEIQDMLDAYTIFVAGTRERPD